MTVVMKMRPKSKFRRLAEVVVLLSVTAVSAVLFQRHQTADEVDEAALRKTEAVVQDVAERSEDLVKNGPRYFVDGLKAVYNPSEDVKYNRVFALDYLLEKEPDNLSALDKRARLLAQLELYDAAVADLDHLIELRPDVSLNYYRRAWVLMKLDLWEEAKPDLERFLAGDPDLEGYGSNSYAYVLAKLGDFEKALPYVEESLAKRKGAHSLDTLGYILVGLERYEEAVEAYTEALGIDPQSIYALRVRAVAFCYLGDHENSEADLVAQRLIDSDFCLHWASDFDPGDHKSHDKGVLLPLLPKIGQQR